MAGPWADRRLLPVVAAGMGRHGPNEMGQAVRQNFAEDDEFLKTAAANRGFELRAFDSIDKAVAWLARGT
ncbi:MULTISPECIES: hypothetical protein [Geobacter]|uniref:Uncharacterized protein n=1 Tax=Geobacter anodireducens TaxID=1340425 RepID=A0ABR9NVT5_9BACT|nr:MULTISPECIES: hypothetical protein [Geobacter]ANA39647.1 hypothetical protein A2G06_03880 [Geobacter anodireducens]MBE2888376.1 hypothetical protein [Geobacter anodireducens]HMN03619.1 hypothetical protein [Geobacter anodireducens]